MGFTSSIVLSSTLLYLVAFAALSAHAADPDEIRNFAPPTAGTPLDGNYFTFTRLRNIHAAVFTRGPFANVTVIDVNVFPALSGLGVANALLVFPADSEVVPHTHPRGTETLFVIEGTLEVGFVDTTAPMPTLFRQTLQKDDIFLFPRGLVHFAINKSDKTARAYASFSSTNPGVVSLPRTLFGVNIDTEVLTKSFQVSPYMIKALSAHQS